MCLENRLRAISQGFESLSLRQFAAENRVSRKKTLAVYSILEEHYEKKV